MVPSHIERLSDHTSCTAPAVRDVELNHAAPPVAIRTGRAFAIERLQAAVVDRRRAHRGLN